MKEEDYFVQVAHRRPESFVPPPTGSDRQQEQEQEQEQEQVSEPEKGVKFRQLTPEQREKELADMRTRDNPRVRAIFDLIDQHNSGQGLPGGVRVCQGDIVAPGLVLEENPFPEWFDAALRGKGGFEYDKGCASYTKMVTGKLEAERWAKWVVEILEAERKASQADGKKPLAETTEVLIREDHRALLNDILS